jgi:deoxyribonuclease-4
MGKEHYNMQTKKHRLLLGAHISIGGGLYKAIERGTELGCTTIQFFVKSNRQWHAKKLTNEEVEFFKEAHKQSPIDPLIAHASYLINLGSPHAVTAQKSYLALLDELIRCNMLGIKYLVLHPGSHLGTDVDACLAQIAHYVSDALNHVQGSTTILFETMAGQGTSIGSTLEQLAQLIRMTKSRNIGICVDTCHLFAAGYDFRAPTQYHHLWNTFDKVIGMQHLKVIHCNDSVNDIGSHIDRHANIGMGKIGLTAFKLLMNDNALFNVPKILETPKKDPASDAHNIQVLLDALSSKTKRILGI